MALDLAATAICGFALYQRGKALGTPAWSLKWGEISKSLRVFIGAWLIVTCYASIIVREEHLAHAYPAYDVSAHSPDVEVYEKAGRGIASGGVPWRDFFIEYPAAAAYFVAAPHLGDPQMSRTTYAYRYMVYVAWILFAGTLFCGGLWLLRGPVGYVAFSILCWSWGVAYMGELTYIRMEPLIAALVLLGVTAIFLPNRVNVNSPLGSGKGLSSIAALLGGLFLGLATAKLYPVFLILALIPFILQSGKLRAYITGVTLGLLPTVIPGVLGPANAFRFLNYHEGRRIEVGSLWGTLAQGVPNGKVVWQYSCLEWHFAGDTWVLKVSTLLTIIASLAPLLCLYKSRQKDLRACYWTSMACIAGFIFFNKVGSPQYATWILSLGAAGALTVQSRSQGILHGLTMCALFLFSQGAHLQMGHFFWLQAERRGEAFFFSALKNLLEAAAYLAILYTFVLSIRDQTKLQLKRGQTQEGENVHTPALP